MPNEQKDQDAACQSHGQPEDVDQAVSLIPNQISKSDGQIMVMHHCSLRANIVRMPEILCSGWMIIYSLAYEANGLPASEDE